MENKIQNITNKTFLANLLLSLLLLDQSQEVFDKR